MQIFIALLALHWLYMFQQKKNLQGLFSIIRFWIQSALRRPLNPYNKSCIFFINWSMITCESIHRSPSSFRLFFYLFSALLSALITVSYSMRNFHRCYWLLFFNSDIFVFENPWIMLHFHALQMIFSSFSYQIIAVIILHI